MRHTILHGVGSHGHHRHTQPGRTVSAEARAHLSAALKGKHHPHKGSHGHHKASHASHPHKGHHGPHHH